MSIERKKSKWPLLATATLVTLLLATAFSGVLSPVSAAKIGKSARHYLGKVITIGHVYHMIGNLWVNLTNYGWMGDDNMATPSMEWPGGSGNMYLYQGSIWVSGRDASGSLHATAGDESEFFPTLGSDQADSYTAANGGVEFTSDDYRIVVGSSNMGINLDPDEVFWYDNDLYGRKGFDDDGDGLVDEDPLDYIDNDGDGLINEDYAMVSEEDTYCIYNDLRESQHATGDSPMGVEVIERTYQWSYSYARDFLIYDYTVINVGTSSNGDSETFSEINPDTPGALTDVYLAIRFDFDISFNASGEYWYDDLTAYLESDHLSYGWDGDDPDVEGNDAGEFGISTGYLGVRTLGYSPDYLATDPNVGSGNTPSSHNWWTIDDDPSSDALKFQFMSNHLYAAEPPSPYDYRYLHSVGPWDMAPGDTIRWYAAVGVGEGLGDPNNPDPHNNTGSLRDIMAFAQELYDADWLAATPPPAPSLTVTAQADGSLLLDWSVGKDELEAYIDPLSGVADFEGYRLYKSETTDQTGARIWLPLAAYDVLGDGIGGETGLQYIYTDRDVLKGFTYYYAVTSFDDGLTAIGELESSRGQSTIEVNVAAPPAADLSEIAVVPNPYLGSAVWDHVPTFFEQWWAQLQFINLPAGVSTIRIYTLSGDLLQTIVNDDGDSFATWDLITRRNGDIASGLYIFTVENAAGKVEASKFVVAR